MVVDMNNQFYQGPRLSLAVGSAVCEKAGGLELALRAADDAMYVVKRAFYAGQGGDRRST
jgi:GGDEF domain-containing protein